MLNHFGTANPVLIKIHRAKLRTLFKVQVVLHQRAPDFDHNRVPQQNEVVTRQAFDDGSSDFGAGRVVKKQDFVRPRRQHEQVSLFIDFEIEFAIVSCEVVGEGLRSGQILPDQALLAVVVVDPHADLRHHTLLVRRNEQVVDEPGREPQLGLFVLQRPLLLGVVGHDALDRVSPQPVPSVRPARQSASGSPAPVVAQKQVIWRDFEELHEVVARNREFDLLLGNPLWKSTGFPGSPTDLDLLVILLQDWEYLENRPVPDRRQIEGPLPKELLHAKHVRVVDGFDGVCKLTSRPILLRG